MPDILGTNVSAPVRPYHTDCTYPTALADEIAGGLKYVATETQLAEIPAERRPVGTVVSVGFGRFRQWTGTNWQPVLQGFDPPTVTHTASEVRLQFDTIPVTLKPVNATSAGVMLPSMFSRLMGHGKKHLEGGDDVIAATVSTPNLVPQADKYGRISSGWLPFGTGMTGGIVRVADDGTSPQDVTGTPVAVLRANDSRLARIPELLALLDELSLPIRDVNELPAKNAASRQSFYWLKPEETLYLLIDQTWTPIAGRRVTGQAGKSAYEIARDQGYPGSIDEWLLGLRGMDGLDGEDGKSAYELARDEGFSGTVSEWLVTLRGEKGDRGEKGRAGAKGEPGEKGEPGDTGPDGKSAYELAVIAGYSGSEPEWLTSLQGMAGPSAYESARSHGFTGTEGDWLASLRGPKGESGAVGSSAYELTVMAGYSGSEPEWLASLRGVAGPSAYESARSHGFTGTESDWLASLRGQKGESGADGSSAYELAVEAGYPGSEPEWLASLRGEAGPSAYESARSTGFTGTEADWLASLKGEKGESGEKGEQGHGIIVLDYYDTFAEFIAAHPTGSPGDFYGVAGDLYLWAQGAWKNLGRLIGAMAFEFELLMEQAGIEGASLEDFFRETVNEALSDMDFSMMVQTEVEAWMTTHFVSLVSPLVTNWLDRNIGAILDSRIAAVLANQLPAQLTSHISEYHEWLPV